MGRKKDRGNEKLWKTELFALARCLLVLPPAKTVDHRPSPIQDVCMKPGFGAFLCFLLFSSSLATAQLPTEPLQGYIYVEPFEIRKEFAFRLNVLPDWQARAAESLDVAAQETLLKQITAQLGEACPLVVDGRQAEFDFSMIRFVQVNPDLGVVKDTRPSIPVGEAMIAAVFTTPRDAYPAELTLKWNFFPQPDLIIPVHFVAKEGRGSYAVTKDAREHSWLVPRDETPGLVPVPVPVSVALAPRLLIPVWSLVLLGLALIAGAVGRFAKGGGQVVAGLFAGVLLVAAVATWGWGGFSIREPGSEVPTVREDQAAEIVNALLLNIYHAFDHRDESKVYDVLDASVNGPLLERVYIDVLRGLQFEDGDGPRVKVTHLDLRQTHPEPLDGEEGFRCDTEWVAVGNVVHWGHSHTRLNKYHAWLTIKPVDGTWKVTNLEIVEEGRI
jgi:hypothetical protein